MSQSHELWVVFKKLVTVVAVILIFRRPKYLNSKYLQGTSWLKLPEQPSSSDCTARQFVLRDMTTS